jgi:protein-S-isoprenylcysteine O-methyltransferase Ste14
MAPLEYIWILIVAASGLSPATAFLPSQSQLQRIPVSPSISSNTIKPQLQQLQQLQQSTDNDTDQTTTTVTEGSSSSDNEPSLTMFGSLADENGNAFQQFVHRFLSAGGGEIGNRGELYFFAQALPIVGIAVGFVPGISYSLRLVFGPGFMLLGIIFMTLTALDMGAALTPWPKPNGEGLVTNGLYGEVRHPMYAGLLASLLGFSVWTESVDRLLLVALLAVILDIKSDYEERELAKVYTDYPDYQQQVTSKFIPQTLLGVLLLGRSNSHMKDN